MKSRNDSTPSLRPFKRQDGLALTGTLLALGQLAASAQDKAKKEDPEKIENLGEVVVDAKTGKKLYKPENLSSPKYVKPLRDVAQTVAVIPKEVIQDQQATTLTEVLRNIPGISIQAGEGGGASNTAGDSFTLRGFNGTNSIFVDGVRNEALITRDPYNIEQVEAFLGPTGADVGRGTAAGYINLATKAPLADDFYRGSVAYGTAGFIRNTVDLNQTLPDSGADWIGKTALRFNGLYQEGCVAGRDRVERDSWAIAPSVAFGLGTDTRVVIQYEHVDQDNTPDYGVPSRNGYPIPGIDTEWYYGSLLYDYDFEDVTQDSVTVRVEHEFNQNFKLLNQTRYSESDRLAVISGIGFSAATGVTRTRQGNERHNRIFNNQTILSAKFDTGPLKHSVSGGIEVTYEEQYSPTLTGVGTYTGATTPLAAPYVPNPWNPVDGFELRQDPTFHSTGSTDTLGLFLSDSIELGKHWQLSGGIRTDIYDTRYFAVSAKTAPAPVGTNPDGLVYGVSGDTLYSAKVALTYKPVEASSIYIAYGTTMTPPGTANFTLSESGTNQNNPNLDPQESENIELGAKWDISENLAISGAVFHTENTNVIYVSNADTNPPTYSVDGGQKINGATLSVNGRITDKWNIQASAAHLDAELDQRGNVNDGHDVTLTPELSGSLWTTYQLPWNLTVGGGIRYQGHASVNAANTIKVPSYAVVDAMVRYKFSEQINIQANINNVLDREYRASINNNGQRYTPGAPLNMILSTNFSF